MDQSSDLSGRERYRLAELLDAPEFVKQAEGVDLCGDISIPAEAYADPLHRLYPCHTPAATWASTAFFMDKRASFSKRDAEFIDERLGYYAAYHEINHAIKNLRDKFAEANKPVVDTLSDDDYALVVKKSNEVDIVRRYPLRNSSEVKAAAAYLHTHRDRFPFNLRRDWADKVLQKAASFGVDLGDHSDYIERQAGGGYCTMKTAVDLIKDRVNASRNGPGGMSELQVEMLKLADELKKDPVRIHEPGVRVKLASVIDDFDRVTGIWRQYGDRLPRVEDVIFDLTVEKIASAAKDHVSTMTGNIYSTVDLEKVSWDQLNAYLGDDFANAISKRGKLNIEKAAEIIPTLDRGMAQAFDAMMQAAGLQPAAKEAGGGYGLSHDYLLRMAADYRKAMAMP
jgi:hypothetical protein